MMKPTIRSAAFLILLCALTRNLGYFRVEIYELLAICCFLVITGVSLSFVRGHSLSRHLAWGAILAVLAAAFLSVGELSRIVLLSAVLFASSAAAVQSAEMRKEGSTLALTAFLFGLYLLAFKHCGFMWHLAEGVSIAYSGFLGNLLAKNLALSASAAGFHISVLFMLFYLSLFAMSESRSILFLIRALIVPAVLMGAFVLGGCVWQGAAQLGQVPHVLTHFDLLPLLMIASLIILWIESSRVKLRQVSAIPTGHIAVRQVFPALLLGLSLLVLILPEPGAHEKRKILVFDKKHILWRTPRFGWYGDRSSGMFGNLVRYLQFRGFEARRDTISAETLKDADVIVAINLAKPFTDDEYKLTWDFVRGGGALLALGDHTGMETIRMPFNALLKPVGIEFGFDSAKGFPASWVDGMEWRPHETTRMIKDENSTQIWTGASLKLDWTAFPVVLGRFAWSDSGDASNVDRGLLGDFQYHQGELLGDIVLAAEARYGKGKVMAFGDTSPFQNGAVVQADAFTNACIQWLLKEGKGDTFRRLKLALGLALLAVAAVFIVRGGISHLSLFLLSLALLTSPLVNAFAGRPPPRTGSTEEKVAYIDKAHGNRFDLNSWDDDSIGGLVLNLMRNDFLTFIQRRFSEGRLSESDLLVVLSPTKEFSSRELRAVDEFVRAGKVLLVVMGNEQYKIAPSLLDHFGFSVPNVPLGRVETEGLGKPVQFYDAYPMESTGSDTTVICQTFDLPVAVLKPWGEGAVLAVGDTRFLLNKNLEGREEYLEENIMFLRQLFAWLGREGFPR